MKYAILGFLAIALIGCGKQQETSEEKVGTATTSSFSEVIGASGGYIIENARIAMEGDEVKHSIANACELAEGMSNVLIVHNQNASAGGNTILALQFPNFAPGTEIEYAGEPGTGSFFVYGDLDGMTIAAETGLISGTVRLIKKEESEVTLGLNRDVMQGIGEMEIVVSAIDPNGLDVESEKKFVARFELPIVTLEELTKMNMPA